MKYLLSFLLIIFLTACGSPAGHAVKEIGYTVTQCCASLSFHKANAPMCVSGDETAGGTVAVAIFEPEMQLIHTW